MKQSNEEYSLPIVDKFFSTSEKEIIIDFIDRYNPELWSTIYKDINPVGKIEKQKAEYIRNKVLELINSK